MMRHFEERDRINEWFKQPKYRVWKYVLIGIGVVNLLVILSMIIWIDSMKWETMMILRGCAGAIAIIFVCVCAVFYYIVYKDYIQHRYENRNKE